MGAGWWGGGALEGHCPPSWTLRCPCSWREVPSPGARGWQAPPPPDAGKAAADLTLLLVDRPPARHVPGRLGSGPCALSWVGHHRPRVRWESPAWLRDGAQG